MPFNTIPENKTLAKIFEFTVVRKLIFAWCKFDYQTFQIADVQAGLGFCCCMQHNIVRFFLAKSTSFPR